MGKPFESELNILGKAYDWALKSNIDELKDAIAAISELPLICVGSGGAYTTANFTAQLHESAFLQVSKAITPLVFREANPYRQKAVLILSAGGGNPDVLGALKSAIEQEPSKIIVLCLRKESPLSKLASKYRNISVVEFSLPWERDGFLATNSLLVFNLLLLRAYWELSSSGSKLPKSLSALIGDRKLSSHEKSFSPLWERPHLVVLFGPTAGSAGIDIESKFTEAALGVSQIADYRNFAHGRHFWLSKHGETTAVLALITRDDKALAEATINLIPKGIPIVRMETRLSGALADLALTVLGFYATGSAGKAKSIDPGRPGVPRFGSQIYRLNAFGKLKRDPRSHLQKLEEVAICRKTQSTITNLRNDKSLATWRKAYRKFIDKIQGPNFRIVIFDYDGTLCDGTDRFVGIGPEVSVHLEKLLRANVVLGIATGRGKSVREDLQTKLPKELWPRVFIGYYNGSVIGSCDDDSLPLSTRAVGAPLVSIADTISRNPTVQKLSDVTFRKTQITIEPRAKVKTEFLWKKLQHLVSSTNSCNIVRSSHSFDIVGKDVSKCNLVKFIQDAFPDSLALCIGDKGNFPGNDYSLLLQPYSLSVDEVSSDEGTCWNIAPPNYRGVQATLMYLASFTYSNKGVRIRLK